VVTRIKPGTVLQGFKVEKHLNKGQRASSYLAFKNGQKVFLKQCSSPTIKVSWYKAYIKYEEEVKRRLETTRAKNFCVAAIEFFESDVPPPRGYFQAFEFIEGGTDLQTVIDKARTNPRSLGWDQRLTFARVMMAGVKELHACQIIHGDLKPANLQMIHDSGIGAGYQLKLIDMDGSVLMDKTPPWEGEGNLGSPNYFSPEHLQGKSLRAGSDVFTCGLILYQLLGGRHPYWCDDPDAYEHAIKAYRAPLPNLLGDLGSPEATAALREYIRACLHPDASRRPAAAEVHASLIAKGRTPPPRPPKTSPLPDPPLGPAPTTPTKPPTAPAKVVPVPPGSTEPAPMTSRALKLVAVDSGKSVEMRIKMRASRYLLGQLGPDSLYFGDAQFDLCPDGTGGWSLVPVAGAVHATLLNGAAVDKAVTLRSGDRVAVGRPGGPGAPAIEKLPMTVEIGG